MSYQLINVNGPIVLSWPLPYTGGLTVATFNNLNVVLGNPNVGVALPPANNVDLGSSIIFNNVGLISCPMLDYGGIPLTGLPNGLLAAGAVITVYLTDNSDARGSWQVISASGIGGITSLKTQNLDDSIVIIDANSAMNPTTNPPGGTLTFSCVPSISNLTAIGKGGANGIVAAVVVGGIASYSTTAILGTPNIVVTNNNGTGGNPTITLATSLTNMQEINIGTTTLIGSNISDTTALSLSAPTVTLNGVAISNTQNITGINSITAINVTATTLTLNGGTSLPGAASAWVRFTDNGGRFPGNITIIDSYNIAPQNSLLPGVIGAQGSYAITYAAALDNANYAISVSLIRGTETIAPLLAYPTSPINTRNMQLMTIDTLGNLLPVTDGVSVIIYATSS